MSESKGPFDAAITHLTNRLNSRGEGSEREELRQAIHILEAAGKVDIRSAQYFVDGAGNYGEGLAVIKSDSSRYLYQAGEQAVRALLEALAPKEEKQ